MADDPNVQTTEPVLPPDQQIAEVVGPVTETVADETVVVEAAAEPLDAGYVERAKSFSLSEADLRVMPRETVERMMASADRMTIQSAMAEWQQPPPVQQAPPPPPRRENGRFAADAPPEFAYEPFKLQFDPTDEINETNPLVKNMTGLEAHVAKQFDRLHKFYAEKLQAQEQFRKDSIVQQNNAVVDRFVESQGPQWSEVFGKGATSEMNPQSQEFLNRVEVWKAATAMTGRYAANGRRMSLNEALPRARNAIFMEKAFALERATADAKRKELQVSAATKPTGGGPAPTGGGIRQRAAALAGALRR
jgi:hypothetical protein